MSAKTILVTGGAGFIGSHLADKLIEQGNQVIVIDNLSSGKIENLNPKAVFYNTDICSPEIQEIFAKEKPEIVFHLAAQIDVRKSTKDPIADAQINILGSLNLLEAARRQQIKKFIFISTGGAIYGDADIIPTPETYRELPLSPYGIAKLAVEKYLNYYHQVFGMRYCALRLGNVYGPRQNFQSEAGVVAIFCDKILSGKTPIIYGNGAQTRDFIYVKDVVDACLEAIDHPQDDIYNIATGVETNVNHLFASIKELLNYSAAANYAPARPGEQQRSCLDCSKAQKELSWRQKYDLDTGLKETVEWFKPA